MSGPIDHAFLAQSDGAAAIDGYAVMAGLGPVFCALYAVEDPARSTLADWVEVTCAVAHLQVLAAEAAEYKALHDTSRCIFNAMAGAARDWYEYDVRPDAGTWYLKLLPHVLQAYVQVYKKAPNAAIAAARQQAESWLREHMVL